jgi:hypothetical protein
VALAAQGLRNLDHDTERIEDQEFLVLLKAKAKKININAFLTAVILTVITLALP